MENSRFELGMKTLNQLDDKIYDAGIAGLGELGRYIVEFAYGDIMNRDRLSLREREIATVAMLTALGGREPQLKMHLGAAMNVGLTVEELEEVIIQTAPYAGFPTAINAMNVLKQVVAEREIK